MESNSQSSDAFDLRAREPVRWILVIGTSEDPLPEGVRGVAEAVGQALAKNRFGLVAGNWPGVDALVATAFAKEIEASGRSLKEWFIHTVQPRYEPRLPEGQIVRREPGAEEFYRLDRSWAVVVIAGRDSSMMIANIARSKRKPTFPLPMTGGMSRELFESIKAEWAQAPILGVSREEFEQLEHDEPKRQFPMLMRLLRLCGKLRLFYFYDPQDRALLDELEEHLSVMKHNGEIESWAAHEVVPGSTWALESKAHLEQAEVVLLLVSARLFGSDSYDVTKIDEVMRRREAGRCLAIPVILSECDWREDRRFGRLAPLPSNGQPVTQSANHDPAWTDVVKGLKRAIKDFKESGAKAGGEE